MHYTSSSVWLVKDSTVTTHNDYMSDRFFPWLFKLLRNTSLLEVLAVSLSFFVIVLCHVRHIRPTHWVLHAQFLNASESSTDKLMLVLIGVLWVLPPSKAIFRRPQFWEVSDFLLCAICEIYYICCNRNTYLLTYLLLLTFDRHSDLSRLNNANAI